MASMPRSCAFAANSGEATAARMSAESFSSTGAGMPAGPYIALMAAPAKGRLPAAEAAAAGVLALSAVYIALNETFANWQALWFCAGLLAVAITLVRARAEPG